MIGDLSGKGGGAEGGDYESHQADRCCTANLTLQQAALLAEPQLVSLKQM